MVTAIGLVTIPDLITYLTVEHSPVLPPGEATTSSDLPLAQLVSLGGSAVLLALSAVVVLMRGHPNRDITGVFILLLALNLPYLVSPQLPPAVDLPKILLANAFILAIWNVGAPITGLKWLPITVSAISVYSLVGGLILPKYMMYNPNSEKALIAGWELAGPFGHANVLGMYCALSFALTPLITERRWRLLIGSILFVTVVASASRTALISASLIALWWLICWFRSTISVRLVGTFLVTLFATAMFMFPFGDWDPDAFTDRAHVWAESIRVWEQSPVVGMGVNWFLDDAQASGNIAKWAFVGTGHNMVIDTLVKSGLVGLAVLVPLLGAALAATRALRITSQQIACFGFLMAFFVAATTEAVWALLPNLQLFPISGLVFAVLIMSRRDDRSADGLS
ncbi:ligase [Mycobacterium sp. 852014-52144_SCH5372336]|nr:ligase [Mycobacterium sp. 852014-52144_SCH5372336]